MTCLLPFLILCSLAAGRPLGGPLGGADLASIRSAPNLEKRAGLAVDYAVKCVGVAREASETGRMADMTTALEETGAAAELALESLRATGKNASKSPKHFKKAELNSRGLLKRLESLIHDLSVDEREPAEKARERVRKVQEALLLDIMGGGKRR